MGQSIEPCVKYINYKNIKMLTNLGNVMARFQGSQSLFASFIVSTQIEKMLSLLQLGQRRVLVYLKSVWS